MADLGEIEYKVLRDTIRERGTLRMCLILTGIAVWGALAAVRPGAGGLVPLLVLAATFEINFFVHTGVERIGRYLQVFYEEQRGAAGWETLAMSYGRTFPGGLDPLFLCIFGAAAVVNLVSSLAGGARGPWGWVWMVISVAAHVWFGWRLLAARRLAGSQRAQDLERYRMLRSQSAGAGTPPGTTG